MAVHTHKEYDTLSKKDKRLSTDAGIIREELQVDSRLSIPAVPPDIFVLVYPENEVGLLKNFEDDITINGKQYHRKCVNGAVRTDEKELKDYLVDQGYLLIDTIKGENHG